MPDSPSRYERTRCYRRGWLFERAGWLVMAALVAAAAAGVFGGGWLSSAHATRDGFTVEYPRFARAHSPLELTVEWQAQQPETVVWLARAYVDRFDVEEIRPTPAAVTVGPDRIHYTFRARDAGTHVAASFMLEARSAGALRGKLGVERARARNAAMDISVTGGVTWIS